MKAIFSLLIYFSVISVFGQTKTETVDWLNTKTREKYVYQWLKYLRTNDIQFFNDGTFKITEFYNEKNKYNSSNTVPVYEITGNLKYFYQNSIVDTDKEDGSGKTLWYVKIIGDKNHRFIQKYIPNNNVASGEYSIYGNDLYIGVFLDEDTAKRVCKAINHLIALCGGKKEAF